MAIAGATAGNRDFVEHSGGKTEDDATFDLRGGRVRIDHVAAIDSRAHAVHFDASVDDLDFRNFGHDRAEAFHDGDAASAACRRWRAPTSHLRSFVERCEVPRRVSQQIAPILQRILARSVCELVDERFGEEAVLSVRDGAPRADAYVCRRLVRTNVLMLDRVRQQRGRVADVELGDPR